ncbi:MAG: BON domain-containing protein [Acidiferrobacteraceae bacterium]|jgi:osmotically-inducible protein OsmY|nr:BON domain-containing protein [Acidiferrobacteraceae bacterium]MBT4393628.1 BON domain-containing protein [Acidiferrobacteraceae bacterium]MBT4806181.1 BON domain-containing protein [Acidiferrobacteraceae bacterium]MBT5981373.1 BON domain-containing protein [Acidiferrobacteraceae bacterium]MBT6731671.1 BON domain-containing protein [Acidiferrobacteraceae bacterium]
MIQFRYAIPKRPFRHTLLALLVAVTVSGCGIVVATTAVVIAVDVARDRRGVSVYWDDNKIEFDIRGSISDQKEIQNENVSVTVFNGIVLLTGEVPDQRDIDKILDLTKAHKGSQQVINRLELAGKTNLTSRANDGWITTRVKTAMATSGALDPTRVKVVTERANVYLMGLVTRAEAEAAVQVTRSVPGVVRVIKVFEYI